MTYAAGPSFQWNILNYGQITNNVRLQDAKLQQLLVELSGERAQGAAGGGQRDFRLLELADTGRIPATQRRCGDRPLRVAMTQYEQGATDFTTVLTAEQNLFQAQSSLAAAVANVALGATAIYRALGGGWQIREDSEFVTAATRDEMRARTNWGVLLSPAGVPQPPAPGLPSPQDVGPTVRPPEW